MYICVERIYSLFKYNTDLGNGSFFFGISEKNNINVTHSMQISQVNPRDKIYTLENTVSRPIGAALHSPCRVVGLVAATYL